MMFEQSIDTFLLQVVMRYGTEGREILTEFRNKDILDTINSMSDEDLDSFLKLISVNLFMTEHVLNWFIEKESLHSERRFDYDTFYHSCYQKISDLLKENNLDDARYYAIIYKKMIENII